MTVSPARPQDGNPQRGVAESGVEPNDRTRVASLPPTLFKLPNLGASKRTEQPPAAVAYPESGRGGLGSQAIVNPITSPSIPAVPPVPSEPPVQPERPSRDGIFGDATAGSGIHAVTARASSASQGSAESQIAPWNQTARQNDAPANAMVRPDISELTIAPAEEQSIPSPSDQIASVSDPSDSVARPTQVSANATTSTPRAPVYDAPAGRSWMESLGSHGVVIVLLLVVVAAALLTGQGEEDPTAKSLSTQSELLDFDELSADLPLPTHGGDVTLAETQVPTTHDSNAVEENFADMISTPVVASPVVTQPSPQPPAPAEEMATAPAATPVTVLEAPTANPNGGLARNLNSGVLPNGVKTNQFVTPEDGTTAMMVANRVNNFEPNDGLPSLEELAGIQEQSVNAVEPKSAAPARMLSNTPVGISDWSKYLPIPESAVEPDFGTFTPSNQVPQQ